MHVIPGISRAGGGPSRSSQALVAALERAGCETWLLSCKPGETAWVDGVKHFAAPLEGEGLPRFFRRMIGDVKPDVIHLHGIWQWCIHQAAVAAREADVPYIVAPRGMLEPWSLQQRALKKKVALALYQRRDLKLAAALHATAESEAEQFRRLGFVNRVIVSPNGVILPKELPERRVREDGKRRMLFVSRIHLKKGLMELAEAWARVRPEGWTMEIVGTDADGFQAAVERRVEELGIAGDWTFTGPLTDDAKWVAYRRADVFVLPTYSENFGIVVPEALYAEVPVVTTKGTPWGELKSEGCGWWIDIGVEPLAEALGKAMALGDGEREEMGKRGRALVERKYRWEAIGKQMRNSYGEILKM